jgi:hypothetical protein
LSIILLFYFILLYYLVYNITCIWTELLTLNLFLVIIIIYYLIILLRNNERYLLILIILKYVLYYCLLLLNRQNSLLLLLLNYNILSLWRRYPYRWFHNTFIKQLILRTLLQYYLLLILIFSNMNLVSRLLLLIL